MPALPTPVHPTPVHRSPARPHPGSRCALALLVSVSTCIGAAPASAQPPAQVAAPVSAQTPGRSARAAAQSSASPTERYAFGADASAPARAMGGLTGGMDGALYGTSTLGGRFGRGTLYRLRADGGIDVLHDFGAAGDGTLPTYRVVVGRDGALYGTTQTGGSDPSQGLGVVWRLGAVGDWHVLHGFRGGADDGSYPTGPLLSASDGRLYGVTRSGGANGFGVLYRIGVDGGFELLHSFGAAGEDADLRFPVGAPMQAHDATVYGVARDGGAHGRGGVYRWRAADGVRVLASFRAIGDDVAFPLGLVEQPDGCLLGTSIGGGAYGLGTLFRVCGDGSHDVLHSFGAEGDGAWPSGEPTAAGESLWYGATTRGGARDQGTIFRVGPHGDYELAASFDAAAGGAARPQGRLLRHGPGRLWGVNTQGGSHGQGGVFSYDTDAIDGGAAP